MADIIRDAPIGQIIRWFTNNRRLQYPEEKPDFKIPEAWIRPPTAVARNSALSSSTLHENAEAAKDARPSVERGEVQKHKDAVVDVDDFVAPENFNSIPLAPLGTNQYDDALLVDWYDDDADNPHNWSGRKRAAITTIICLYTFVVYTSSAIYTSSTQGVMEEFGVSQLEATLGLSLYVLGYGIGPLIFSPLSEIPLIGRNPVYIVTMILFVLISIPTAFAPDFTSLVVLRFLQGFFGSPCLASGGASLGDLYSLAALPYAMLAWVSASYCGRKSFAIPASLLFTNTSCLSGPGTPP